MTKLLLSVHVLAAILTVGPIAVAASIFPRFARQAAFDEDPGGGAAGGIADHDVDGSARVGVLRIALGTGCED